MIKEPAEQKVNQFINMAVIICLTKIFKSLFRISGGDATMVYSTKTEIHALYLNSKIHFILANNLNKVIDIGINGDHLYWSEFEGDKQTIVKSFFGTKKNVIVTTG